MAVLSSLVSCVVLLLPIQGREQTSPTARDTIGCFEAAAPLPGAVILAPIHLPSPQNPPCGPSDETAIDEKDSDNEEDSDEMGAVAAFFDLPIVTSHRLTEARSLPDPGALPLRRALAPAILRC
jgi:hypothetical protein